MTPEQLMKTCNDLDLQVGQAIDVLWKDGTMTRVFFWDAGNPGDDSNEMSLLFTNSLFGEVKIASHCDVVQIVQAFVPPELKDVLEEARRVMARIGAVYYTYTRSPEVGEPGKGDCDDALMAAMMIGQYFAGKAKMLPVEHDDLDNSCLESAKHFLVS